MPEVMAATGHAGFVTTVAFSPDEKLLASGSYDTTVKLWDLATGIELRTLKGHQESVGAVAFSPDGRTIASASGDGIVNLWDVSSGTKRVLNHIKLFDTIAPDLKIAFSEDANRLLLDVTGTIVIWDIPTRRQRHRIEGASAISRDWKLIASQKDDTIEIRRVDSKRVIHKLKVQWQADSINFSPDGKLLALGDSDMTVKIWSVMSGEIIWALHEPSNLVVNTTFSRDSKTLAAFSSEQAVLWDLATGKEIRSIKNPDGELRAAAFSPNLDVIAAWNDSKFGGPNLQLWDFEGTQNIRVLPAHNEGIVKAVFSPNGTTVATCSYDNTVRIWNVKEGTSQKPLKGGAQGIGDIEISQDGKTLAMHFYATNTIKLWEIGAGKEPWKLDFAETQTEGSFLQGLSPSGNFYVTGFSPMPKGREAPKVEVKIWDTVTRREVAQLPDHASVPDWAFSASEEVIATLDEGTIRIWDLRTGQKIRTIYTNSHSHYLYFSLSGKTIAALEEDSTVTLWDCQTGKRTLTLAFQDAETIADVAFSADDHLVAIAGCSIGTCSIKLWNAKTGRLLGTLKRYASYSGDGRIRCSISFSTDGRLVSVVSKEIIIVAGDTSPQNANMRKVDLFDTRTRRQLMSLDYDDPRTFRIVFPLVPATYSNIFRDSRFMISIGDSGKLAISDVKTGRLLAELLALNTDDWLTVTPDGLFDGTPEAWNQIRWRFNNNTFDHAPLEAFYNDYYRPGLLAEIMALKYPKAPADLSQKDRRVIDVSLKATPFDLTQPNGSRTVPVQVEVKETPAGLDISDKTKQLPRSGARDLRLFRNGSLVKLWSGDLFTHDEKEGCKQQTQITSESPRSSICTATIPIVAGENKLVAYAFNDANVKSENANLTITGSDTLTRNGTLHILAIGVGRYTNAAFDLNYTPDDARSFASQLKLQQEKLHRYQTVEVTIFLNENATKENILAELRRLSGASQPEDGVVVYFSGHGKASGDHFFLMPHDIGYLGPRDQLSDEGLQQILRHSISDLDLEKAFRDIDAEHILMIIDACNSGQALENKDEPRRGPMNTRGLAQLAYEKGMYILTASQNAEEAFVSEGLKYSYLTYVLVEDGLKTNSADLDGNGDITLQEWFDYAASRVPKLREEMLERKSLEEFSPGVKSARSQKSQTPRVFYRRETDVRPFIVASLRPIY